MTVCVCVSMYVCRYVCVWLSADSLDCYFVYFYGNYSNFSKIEQLFKAPRLSLPSPILLCSYRLPLKSNANANPLCIYLQPRAAFPTLPLSFPSPL